jgi:hypothetical protein
MFRVILGSLWKWSRLFIVTGSVAAFAVPILSVQSAGGASPALPGELLSTIQSWSVFYPTLAGALGLLTAMRAWAPDHAGRHVYALVLPLPRWRYVLLRFAAGLVLLAGPVLAVTLGALLATATATLPAGLHGYPLALALRFTLAVLVAYGVFFAVSSGTARTAGVLIAALGVVVVAQVLASAANLDLPIAETALRGIFDWPGPLAIFASRWMLIDV